MNLFSISDLEKFSGIKAHTIRIWEQRYDALKPDRSVGNQRYYNGDQLRRLLNIASLMDSDYKVSELCRMADSKLSQILDERSSIHETIDKTCNYFISQLIAAGMDFNEVQFEKIFSSSILKFGIKETYTLVLYPMLVRVGLMWAKDSIPPAQEHFISNIIRQKLFTAIDSLPPSGSPKNSWLLFLPEEEFHEIGLLISNYIIRHSGKKVFYLGANVPFESLNIACNLKNPDNLLLFMVHYDDAKEAQKYLTRLSKEFKGKQIHVSGNKKLIGQLKLEKRVHWVQSVEDLEEALS